MRALALVLALLAPPVLGAPPPEGPPEGREREARLLLAERGKRMTLEERQELEQEVRRKMQAYVAVKLSSRLGLDETTAGRLAAALERQGERRLEAKRQARAAEARLEELLSARARAEELAAQIQAVLEARRKGEGFFELLEETRAFLTVEQQARLTLGLPEVTREVRQIMRRSRRGPGPHGARGR